MKCAVEVGLGVMIYLPGFTKIDIVLYCSILLHIFN
jgi:hypothetical protein